ncbi:MAG: MarR family transcriptional regulator, partial [Turicibacter sp.]|nr:MarR family transcriptional regulator [Turicibacter sp.]
MSGTDFLTVTDRYVIRERNEKLVLKTIIRRDSISRADIAKETLLNKATVSSIVADLLDRNLLTELGEGQSSGGRKPILVRFNHQAGIVLSVDLRPDRMIFLFTYLNGEPLMEERLPKIKMTNET